MTDCFRVVMILAFVLVVALFATRGARSHDFYPTECCNGQDCQALEGVNRVEETPTEFVVDGKLRFNKGFVKPSPDGRYHACIRGGSIICFFVPAGV